MSRRCLPSPTIRGRSLLSLLLVLSMILAGCSAIGRSGVTGAKIDSCYDDLVQPSAITGLFIQPDDGYAPVSEELASASCTIDVTVYMLTDETIFSQLIDAADRGVRVRVILDEHPYGMFGDQQEAMDRLEAGGVDVRWGPSSHQFTHAKYIVIDDRIALIMNQNLTGSAFQGNREFGVITTEPAVVLQASQLFAADWTGSSSGEIDGPLIVSPENSRTRIVELIDEAEVSIDFYAEVIRDSGIIAALEDAIQRGVSIRLIVNATVDPEDADALAGLSELGVEVRMMDSMYIHAKAMILDREAALIGSHNYTMTSLDRNREVGMVVNDPAVIKRAMAIYERDWLNSIPASAKEDVSLYGPSLKQVAALVATPAGSPQNREPGRLFTLATDRWSAGKGLEHRQPCCEPLQGSTGFAGKEIEMTIRWTASIRNSRISHYTPT